MIGHRREQHSGDWRLTPTYLWRLDICGDETSPHTQSLPLHVMVLVLVPLPTLRSRRKWCSDRCQSVRCDLQVAHIGGRESCLMSDPHCSAGGGSWKEAGGPVSVVPEL
jgi:hypothetical protein